MLKGIGASPGIAIGKVIIKKENRIKIEKMKIDNFDLEIERLLNARIAAKEQINQLYKRTLELVGKEEARIFEAHAMILGARQGDRDLFFLLACH